VIILNKEINLPSVALPSGKNKAVILTIGGVVLLAIIAVGALIITSRLNSSNVGSSSSLASEGSPSALSGSHNECANFTCIAKEGIGPNDCTTNLDCKAIECDEVTVDPPKPAVGAANVKFTCQGILANSAASIASVTFKIESPASSSAEEYSCPGENCTLLPSSGAYTASLSYPKALARGTYKVMTRTCFRIFSSTQVCGDYKLPAL
jgi:hypothetical protein